MDISLYKQFIEDTVGIYIDAVRTSILEKAIDERMAALQITDKNGYFEYIRQQTPELKNLVSLITINESYFFREIGQVKCLLDTIVPELIARKPGGYTIKLLSAGCSTGEEPYSIAIAFNEKYGSQTKVRLQIFAFDVDKQVIATAKNGIYGKSSFRSLDTHLRDKYFTLLPSGQRQLDASLRKQVTFFEHNLLDDDFPSMIRHMDIIFYRNVSIYFKPRAQKKVFEKLAGILNQQGYLFMSATETFVHDIRILHLMELADCFVFKKTEAYPADVLGVGTTENGVNENIRAASETRPQSQVDVSLSEQIPAVDPHSKPQPEQIQATDHRNAFNRVLELLRYHKPAEALDVVNFIETHHPGSKKLLMLKARVLFELKQLAAAKAICVGLIEKDQWYEWPYLYLGFFASYHHANEEFVKQLKKAIYVRPTCWLAHYYLAQYYYAIASFGSAAREMRNVIRLLEKNRLTLNETELFLEPIDVENVLTDFKEKLTLLDAKLA